MPKNASVPYENWNSGRAGVVPATYVFPKIPLQFTDVPTERSKSAWDKTNNKSLCHVLSTVDKAIPWWPSQYTSTLHFARKSPPIDQCYLCTTGPGTKSTEQDTPNIYERHSCTQWRTQKIFMGGFHSVAFGGHLYLVCAVCDVTIWRHIHVSKPTFSRNFLTQHAYSSARTPLNSSVIIALNENYQRSRLRYRRKINSTLRHRSSRLRKYQAAHHNRGVKHKSLRQSNLQL